MPTRPLYLALHNSLNDSGLLACLLFQIRVKHTTPTIALIRSSSAASHQLPVQPMLAPVATLVFMAMRMRMVVIVPEIGRLVLA